MPTSRSQAREALVDTSVAVALALSDHAAHASTLEAVAGWRLGLAGHAWFETFSVLTRLPGDARRAPREVCVLLERNFPATRSLGARAAQQLVRQLADLQIAGGAVYDALVAAVAREHQLPLITRDRRAVGTYGAFDVDVIPID